MQKISVKLRKNSKSEKGITLVALITTVILLALVSVPIALHVRDVSAVRDFTEFKDDLLNLRESISESYQQSVDFSENENDTESYIGPKYEGDLSFLNSVQDGKNVKNPNDDNNYYIVDYNVLNQKLQSKLGIHMEKLNYGYTNKYIDDSSVEKIELNDAKALINKWQDILKEVKKESVKLFAFLQEGKPMGFEKEALVVKFDKSHKFHSERIMQDENRYIIEKVLRKYVQGDIVLQVFCEKEEGEFAKRYDITKEAVAVFGEDIVTIED